MHRVGSYQGQATAQAPAGMESSELRSGGRSPSQMEAQGKAVAGWVQLVTHQALLGLWPLY